jgi:tetratricopeptide (TPR) repeat protein
MLRHLRCCGVVILLLVLPAAVRAQSTQSPSGESTSRPAEQPPSPPDAPIPDQGATPAPESKSRTKRAINKLDPHCIDVVFHTCWSSPMATTNKTVADDERQAAEDIDVGYYYLKDKNYGAAESRLQEALELKPDAGAALLGLAQAQQKLGKRDAARQNYEAYLKLYPDGPDAEKVKKALAQLK